MKGLSTNAFLDYLRRDVRRLEIKEMLEEDPKKKRRLNERRAEREKLLDKVRELSEKREKRTEV